MTRFEKILKDIEDVRIQGATEIAKFGIKAFLLSPDKKSAEKILKTRPTEPLLQNCIAFLLKSKNIKKDSKNLISYIEKTDKRIAKFGSRLITNNMNIFSHCHSSTVISILKYAKKSRKKHFIVYTTEVEPLLQGRKTAKELAKFGIKVIVSPDLAAEQTLTKCDLFLFGADAFLKKGVVNKIGTSTLCRIAKEHNIPRYSCGISLKYAKKIKIEQRKPKELWDQHQKNIIIFNPAFDLTKRKFLSGTISEFGIHPYKQFIKLAKKNLKSFV